VHLLDGLLRNVVAGEDSAVANGTLVHRDGPVWGRDLLVGLNASASMRMSPGAEVGRCDALIVGEWCQIHMGLELAIALPPGGVVEPCVAHKAELVKRASRLEMIFGPAIDVA